MAKKPDIIIITMSRWDSTYSSAILSLAKELSKNNRVFYIDHPYSLKDFITNYRRKDVQKRKKALIFGRNKYRKIEELPENFVAVTPQLTLPINWLPEGYIYNTLQMINNRIFFFCVAKIIKDFNISSFLYINSFDPFFGNKLPGHIKPALYIYQCRDDISQETYTARHGIRLEEEAVKNADLTVTTSLELTRLKSMISANVCFLPNAADVELFKRSFSALPQPDELKHVKNKVIGYMGHISNRLDFELLRDIAHHFPQHSLLLIGDKNDGGFEEAGLDKLKNVIYTGPKKLEELPNYLKYLDCCIIPFKCNTLTRSIYPLKVNEYLAAGKPVVTTNFSEDIAAFRSVIHVAGSPEEFISCIASILNGHEKGSVAARTATADANSWKARTETFWEIVDKNLKKET